MRLRQQNPFNYMTSEKINAEFENVIRYINSAEFGDMTLSELLDQIFDEDTGLFDGPIEFKFDPVQGLMWRIGEYTDPTQGWTVIAPPSAIQGPPGIDVGEIGGPLYYNRQDSTPASGVTVVPYPTIDAATDDVLVYLNGLLQPMAGVYSVDFVLKQVTFTTAFNGTTKLTMFCVAAGGSVNYTRSDQTASSGQTVFAFPSDPDDDILVYRNGILQRAGGAYDYIVDPVADTIIFHSGTIAGDKLTFIIAIDPAVTRVGGLMTTEVYAPTGLIPWTMLLVNDGQIPAQKVVGLTTYLADGVTMTVASMPPTDPATNELWINTALSPNQLNFYDGVRWISTSPASEIPPFDSSDANMFLQVNATGSAYQYANVDFSSLIPKSQKAQPNGVATLDSSGFVLDSQISPQRSYLSMPFETVSVGTTSGLLYSDVVWMQSIRIEGVSIVLETGGTCNVQLAVDQVPTGPVFAVTTTKQDVRLNPMIQIDATTASHTIGLWVSAPASTPGKLFGCFAISTLVVD